MGKEDQSSFAIFTTRLQNSLKKLKFWVIESKFPDCLSDTHKVCNSIEAYIRFTEEIPITAQLEHPNIIPIYEMGVDDNNSIYYTMKLIASSCIAVNAL